ncbi:hypothetical protein SAMN04487911_104196 [Arenibacter nanhaiticus]|uniref:GDSL-like Lipase/Acylhydrolase n=1 Tax=Arenibacter nanhaiticus TaxID=558155 RepID=A0A1M6D8E7_9FLAO|nr:G-D-S-L family lipolytic protein [Arenibacter nanhaiticus]SHI69479.1 hypothetical protein SAMN04487911_104196 [Arenibacter nanhaiticus]
MKNTRYILLAMASLGLLSCESDDTVMPVEPAVTLTAGDADFSTYVAVGGSFTAGFTDGALFVAGQTNSFPNLLSQQFSAVGGGSFTQPLMNDNIGGLVFGGNQMPDGSFGPRLIFDGKGPVPLPAVPTTEATNVMSGPYNNMGVAGIKSFHLGVQGYGALNPYFGRMAIAPLTSILGDALAQQPTFFTLSEIGGNDVLSYAVSGGVGVDRTGNPNAAVYGGNDITDPGLFDMTFRGVVNALTAGGAKGVVTNVPYITDLPHFTTVPHNPLDPLDPDNAEFVTQIPLLNSIFGALNQIYDALQQPNRKVVFSQTSASAVVIRDKTLVDISAQIEGALNASPTFPAFIAQFGLPAQAAPIVAKLLGSAYGQTRQATAEDLLVLPSSSIIGKVNTASVVALMGEGLSEELAGQFSVEGVTLPLVDKWVLLPSEQTNIKVATDAYNVTIKSVADEKQLAFVDFKKLLSDAASTGIRSGNFILNTQLVRGGLIGLDGLHLTARGYAVLTNKFLEAIDESYGSNFVEAGATLNSGNYPTNYPAMIP